MQPPVPGNDTMGPNWSDGFANQTVRQVIRVSRGGSQVRVRLSNLYGTKPLRVTGPPSPGRAGVPRSNRGRYGR